MHLPYVLWVKLLATGPKMVWQDESDRWDLYFQTMFSSEPVFSGETARQQRLLKHFLFTFGQSLNPPFEISSKIVTLTKPQRGCASQFSCTIFCCSPTGQYDWQTLVSLEKPILHSEVAITQCRCTTKAYISIGSMLLYGLGFTCSKQHIFVVVHIC